MNPSNKRLIWKYYQESNASPRRIPDLTKALVHEHEWHGFHPLNRLDGVEDLVERFWQPLLGAIPDVQRRPYLFIGGHFEGGDWVASTGDFVGTFAQEWLGLPATGTSVHFRYGEFCRIERGKVVETRFLCDWLELARQAGVDLVPRSPGVEQWIPGPLKGGGVLLEPQDPEASAKTLGLVEAMIFEGLNEYDQKSQDSQGLERYWHPHMVWHGPVGTGSAYGLDDFKKKAQGPIVRAFPDRKGAGHKARIAEGEFAASTGWPSLVGTHRHTFMDWEPTGKKIGWNIMDFWRRDGDKLLENWVLIDFVHAALQSGVDLLAGLEKPKEGRLGQISRGMAGDKASRSTITGDT